MRKKLKKLCALVLSAVTVLSILPSSGLVNAETDTDITAEESVQSTVYFKVPNPSGQVIVTSNADTDEEVIQTITVDKEKTTLTDNDGNTSDVTLTEEGYCLELTEEVGETITLEFVASDGYEVGTYHILTDTGDENESVEETTLSDDNKYEYTFTEESQVLEVTFTAIETENVNTQEDTVPVDEFKTTPVKEEEPTSEEETTIPEGEETMENNESLISITEGFDYSTIADLRCDYSERDWSKYGIDDSTIEYYKEKGIDILTDETHGSHLEDRLKKTSSNKLRTANAKSASYYVGQQISGTANITSVYFDSSNGQSYFWFNLGGNLSGWGLTANAWCADNTAAEPPVGHPIISVTATITKIENGYAYANVLLTPQGVTDGVSRDEYGRLYGYQHIAGTIRIPYQPTGSGYIVKTSSNTSLTSGNSNYNLTGATYNIYKTKSDAQNNKNAISGKQFKIASNSGKSNTVELNAGTYYIKEVNGSDGTGYTTSSTIYTITITAGQYGKNLTPSGGIKNTPKTATIDLYKTPSNPVCVENNENYTLEGAVYGIYTDSSCTSLKTKATTNADGEFSVTGLPLGQYWVKEISPSPGYLVDINVYAVDARKEGSEAVRVFTVESYEVPIMDPGDLILKKVDSNTNGTMEDQGTMEGAEFIAKFYGVAVEDIADGTDPATLGYQPTRTWRLKTTEVLPGQYGIDLYLGNALKVSGDEFYYENGDVSLPFGILTFQEVKSPNGYLINDEIIVQEISDKNGGNDTAIVEHVSTQKEDSLTLRLVKTQYDTDEVIPGVTYRWTRPDGTVNTYTTDKNGVIEFHGLTWGKHTIEEIDVPDGYAVNTNKIEFTVAQDNTITFDKEYPMSDTNGVITISLDTEGNMDVDYTNKPAPFDLKIHKVNNHNFPLEGAEFTLYSDEKCTQVVDVQVTDSDGELTFADLIPYKEYWMKETDAPPGYRIPVNDDGSDIIWKIDVESVPVNDEFTFNVNDTAYTIHSTGSIWIDGTKADRVCNMTVVNEVGMKLPNTGSSMMILLLIAGVMLMGGAIVISRKSRKTSDDKE